MGEKRSRQINRPNAIDHLILQGPFCIPDPPKGSLIPFCYVEQAGRISLLTRAVLGL